MKMITICIGDVHVSMIILMKKLKNISTTKYCTGPKQMVYDPLFSFVFKFNATLCTIIYVSKLKR